MEKLIATATITRNHRTTDNVETKKPLHPERSVAICVPLLLPPIRCRLYKPVPGILVLRYVPFGPNVILAPRGPIVVLMPFFPKLSLTPGIMVFLFLQLQAIIILLSFSYSLLILLGNLP